MSEPNDRSEPTDEEPAPGEPADAAESGTEGYHRRGDVDHSRTMWIIFGVLVVFFGLAWGSIPLYRLVCKSLDPGGSAASNGSADQYKNVEVDESRKVTVRFTTNVQDDLNWDFRSRKPSVRVHPGQKKLVNFTAKNHEDEAITGKGVYDINPPEAGAAFKKIECFCFQQQTLEANEQVEMPLYFWLEPDDLPDDVQRVTIGYTFFDASTVSDSEADKRAAAGQ